MEDREIIALYWERSERAITETAKEYGSYCHTIAYHILQNKQDAEECVNDVYLSAWNAIPPARPERLPAYLGKATRNLALNRLRFNTTEKRGGGGLDAVFSELEECITDRSVTEEENGRAVGEAINRFLYRQPEHKRSLFIRRYFGMEPVKEIARHYRMSAGQVTTILFRMRKELKKHLEKEGIDV